MIQDALARILDGHDLGQAEARAVMDEIMRGKATPGQIGGFLIALRLKGETADEIVAAGANREDVVTHRFRAARYLVGRLTLRAQRDQKSSDLRRRCLAAHDLVHHCARFRARQLCAVEQFGDDFLDHPVRKFRAISRPSGVRTDSGWNCTPWTFSVR